MFERDGYLDARVVDISKEAGVSAGSFYTYFDDKKSVFEAVVEAFEDNALHPHIREGLGQDDVLDLIDATNRHYLMTYKRNARLMAVFEQVAQIDEEFRTVRRDRGSVFAERNARMITRLQEEGRADPQLDPLIAAHALSTMVARMAYSVFVLGVDYPLEGLVQTLDRLWASSLQIKGLPDRWPEVVDPAPQPT